MGLFSHALVAPFNIFFLSNGSRLPSFFITIKVASSMFSYVVKRLWQLRHSLRLLIERPSSLDLESITLSSLCPQNGHFMTPPIFSIPCHRNNGGSLEEYYCSNESLDFARDKLR